MFTYLLTVRARTLRLSTRAQTGGEKMARKRHALPRPAGPVTPFSRVRVGSRPLQTSASYPRNYRREPDWLGPALAVREWTNRWLAG